MIWLLVFTLFSAKSGCETTSRSTGVEWPSGAFGLPMSKSGCPGDKKNGWNEGWRFQDMEDDYKKSSKRTRVSIGSHLNVTLIGNKKDINRTFCMIQNTAMQKNYWPNGSYCIYKHKDTQCPMYMDTGWVKWDDEDSSNINKKGGSLPDGSYNKDTVIHYCCQNAGPWYDSIELPVIRPFYLLTSSSTVSPKCQMVKWAFSYLEYIIFDTSDQRNADDQGGKHIFLHGRKLYYCYYKDCRRKLSGPAGSFQSYSVTQSATDPHSQYCSWLITIAETYVVSLNFKELTIPSCNDMFLKIYDGANDTAPLLGTYCGSNATIEVDILSSANNLYVVSNSGGYGTNPRSSFSFDVQYNAEHASGCHYEIFGKTGYIKPPRIVIPKDYPYHSNCSWLVTVNDTNFVVLNVSFLERHGNDVIEIYDGKNESAAVLARYPPLNGDKRNGSLVSSSNMMYIVLKYGNPSGNPTRFALNYVSQPKPTTTEKSKTLQPTSFSVIHTTVKTQDPKKDSAKQSEENKTTYIIVAVVVPVVVVLIIIVIIIFVRRRKKKADASTTLHLNPSYSLRKKATTSDEDSVYYANPSSPQEKVWIHGNSKVCKEGNNPIYEPSDGQEPVALHASMQNTYEPLVENHGRAVESENPLYGVGDRSSSHVYAEPSPQQQNAIYDEPDVTTSRGKSVRV